jgi:hypothetical protein
MADFVATTESGEGWKSLNAQIAEWSSIASKIRYRAGWSGMENGMYGTISGMLAVIIAQSAVIKLMISYSKISYPRLLRKGER